MKTPWLIPAATLLVGAAGGFVTGKISSPPSDAETAEEAQVRSRISDRGSSPSSAADRGRTARTRTLEEIYREPGQGARVQGLVEYYAGLTTDQLEDEARKLENLPMNERLMASFLLFSRWAEVDPSAAMAYSRTMGGAGAFVRPNILQSWASVDPENAARAYMENPREFAGMGGFGGPMGGQNGASIIAAEWAKMDPDAALAWAGTLDQDQTAAMTAVVREVANSDPRRAAELATRLDPAERGDAYNSIAASWASTNFDEAAAWVRTLPANEQSAAMASALSSLARENPQLAATQLASLAPGRAHDDAAAAIATAWSRENPQEAAAWVLSQNSEDAQNRAIRDVMSNWTNVDESAALSFVNSQPAGSVRDNAAASYVMSNRSADPSALVQVAQTIDDDGTRMRTVGMTVGRWMQEDPAAARAYVASAADIPDGLRERILGGGEGGGRGPGGGGGQGRGGRGGR